MSDPIEHLPGVRADEIETSRLRTLLLQTGSPSGEPVLFLHGNCSSSTFWEETMLALPPRFRGLAPDQRGYGSSDRLVLIDATRGFDEWVDDIQALADQLELDRFHLVAHSLGGCIAYAAIGRWAYRLRTATLISPGPPCGFGGARGLGGELNFPDGAGSGAGLVHSEFVRLLQETEQDASDSLFTPRAVMNRLYWKPPFRPPREEQLLAAMRQVRLGDRQFPGDIASSPNWPGFAPGRHGPVNAMSPFYNQGVLERLLKAEHKPPLLWIHGADDLVVADNSLSDAGYQGQLGLRPDWPGEESFPAQPLLSQVRYALEEYEKCGGSVRHMELPDTGHTPYLERHTEVSAELRKHLALG